jgi:hypothetical protein
MSKQQVQKLIELPVDDPRRVDGERERRRYVKRAGGLCKDLSKADIEKANAICADYGLSADKAWDDIVVVPGMK